MNEWIRFNGTSARKCAITSCSSFCLSHIPSDNITIWALHKVSCICSYRHTSFKCPNNLSTVVRSSHGVLLIYNATACHLEQTLVRKMSVQRVHVCIATSGWLFCWPRPPPLRTARQNSASYNPQRVSILSPTGYSLVRAHARFMLLHLTVAPEWSTAAYSPA